ncbi:hypothetical protein SALBM217S_06234 [Streptomyces griseoloalbus]
MLGFLVRLLPFWVREPLLILVGTVFGVRILYLALVDDAGWVAAAIGAVFLLGTALRVRVRQPRALHGSAAPAGDRRVARRASRRTRGRPEPTRRTRASPTALVAPPQSSYWTTFALSAVDAPCTSSALPLWREMRRTYPSELSASRHCWLAAFRSVHWTIEPPFAVDQLCTSRTLPEYGGPWSTTASPSPAASA